VQVVRELAGPAAAARAAPPPPGSRRSTGGRPPGGTGSFTPHLTLYKPFDEARRCAPRGGAGNVHQGGSRHRAKKHPSKNGNAGQGQQQNPDTDQGPDRCGNPEGVVLDAAGFPLAGAGGILSIRATQPLPT
jgi:hypothetical protein